MKDETARKLRRKTRIYWDKSESRAGAKRRRRMASWIKYFTDLDLRQCHEITTRGWIDLQDGPALMMLEDFDWASFEKYPEPTDHRTERLGDLGTTEEDVAEPMGFLPVGGQAPPYTRFRFFC